MFIRYLLKQMRTLKFEEKIWNIIVLTFKNDLIFEVLQFFLAFHELDTFKSTD